MTDWSSMWNNWNTSDPKNTWSFMTDEKKQLDPNINVNYKTLSKKFIDEWISIMKTNISCGSKYFDTNALCTFLTKECVGYDKLHTLISNDYGVFKFDFNVKQIIPQPHNNHNLFINVYGFVNIDSLKPEFKVANKSFNLFFCLTKRKNNSLYVTNYIFNLL
jgi:hypothetical protein